MRELIYSKAYIDGQWCAAATGAHYVVSNPANGLPITAVADLALDDVTRAIACAQRAQPAWAALSAKERSHYLRAWYEAVLREENALAHLLTCEQGKPLCEALAEVRYGASFIEWFSEEGKRAYGRTIPSHSRDKRLQTIKQPIGVVAAITPWNFPIAMLTRKAAPALAAGCSIVIKPARDTPLCALALAALAHEVGIAPGVINVVPSTDASGVGAALCASPLVRKLSFTGSTAVGSQLMAQCAPSVKRLSLELGGNAPFIVFDDADIPAAVAGALASKFRNAGQTCVCANRFLVHEAVYAAFVSAFSQAVVALSVGDGLQAGCQIGPLINSSAQQAVADKVAAAVAAGARVLCGGRAHAAGDNFYCPTVLVDVAADNPILQQEIFGPVAPIVRFHSEAEAIALANATPYGLAAYFYSRDIGRIWRVSEALEFGMLGINEGVISTEVAPFGGVKASGLGREGGVEGLEEYLVTKYQCFGGVA
ncbi:MAG: NAD-dependent succinate-semialdehyde dehydrogenase [Aeromonas sp.]